MTEPTYLDRLGELTATVVRLDHGEGLTPQRQSELTQLRGELARAALHLEFAASWVQDSIGELRAAQEAAGSALETLRKDGAENALREAMSELEQAGK